MQKTGICMSFVNNLARSKGKMMRRGYKKLVGKKRFGVVKSKTIKL